MAILDYRSPDVQRRRRIRSLGEELSKLEFMGMLFIAYGLEGDPEKPVDLFFAAGLLIWGIVAVACARSRWSIAPGSVEPRRVGTGWAIGLLIMLAGTISLFPWSLLRHEYTCPHGTTWDNNQFGIARSTVPGGPCRGSMYDPGSSQVWHVAGAWYVYLPRRHWPD